MAESSKSIAGAIASVAVKRSNPDPPDEQDDVKRCRIERPNDPTETETQEFFPIKSLKPMFACPPIKGELTVVSPWMTTQRQVKFLNFRLEDESGAITGIAFQPLASHFDQNFKQGAIVVVSGAKVETARPEYQTTSQTCRLLINKFCKLDFETTPGFNLKLKRKTIKDVSECSQVSDIVDVVGIVEMIGEIRPNNLREILISDESEANMTITLWDDYAKMFDASLESVVAARGLSVREYGGKKMLRTQKFSKIAIDPQIEDTDRLKKWYSERKAAATAAADVKKSSVVPNPISKRNEPSSIDPRPPIDDTKQTTISPKPETSRPLIDKLSKMDSQTASSFNLGRDRKTIKIIHECCRVSNIVDVVGIVTIVGEISSKNYREIQIVDDSEEDITITLWDDFAKNFNASVESVFAARGLTVREYCGKMMLRTRTFSKISIDPQIEDTGRLKKWYGERKAAVTGNDRFSERDESSSVNHFTSIADIKQNISSNPITSKGLDIAGIVTKLEPAREQRTKAGGKTWMRTIWVADEFNCEIEMTVWGPQLKDKEIPIYSTINADNVTVRRFNGVISLNCLFAQLKIEPDVPQTEEFKELVDFYSKRDGCENEGTMPESSSCDDDPIIDDFTSIDEIRANGIVGRKYNVFGVIIEQDQPESVTTKSGKQWNTRPFIVADKPESQITMTVWIEEGDNRCIPMYSGFEARNVVLIMYEDGKELSCLLRSMKVNPKNSLIDELRTLAPTFKVFTGELSVNTEFEPLNTIIIHRDIDSKCNVIGIVKNIMPSEPTESQSDMNLWTTLMTLKDHNDNEIDINIWSKECIESEIVKGSVMAVRDAIVRISDNEIVLSVRWDLVTIDPNIPAARRLKSLESRNAIVKPSKLFFKAYSDCELDDYTPIEMIIRRNEPGDHLNTIGLVVKIHPQEQVDHECRKIWVKKCVLRGKEGFEIELNLRSDDPMKFDVPINTVIIARNATVRRSKSHGNLALVCRFVHVDRDIDIPEAEGFKEAAMIATAQSGVPVAPDPNYFTDLKVIKMKMPMGVPMNVMGIVVYVFTRINPYGRNIDDSRRKEPDDRSHTLRLMIRDKDRQMIVLNIRQTEYYQYSITVNSVIAIRDALFRMSNDEKSLWCLMRNVEIISNTSLPEELKKLLALPYERGFVPFHTIATEISLIGCRLDIIGQATRIRRRSYEDTYFHEVVLRNGIEIPVRIFEIPETSDCSDPSDGCDAIPLNTIVVVKDALLDQIQSRLTFKAHWNDVEVDPKTHRRDKGSKALSIVKIKKIHQEARVGEWLGVLAVVTTPPRTIVPAKRQVMRQNLNDPGMDKRVFSHVKLIDRSDRTINMIVTPSYANKLRAMEDEIVIIHSVNLQVRVYEGAFELWCTHKDSFIDINPKTEAATKLLKWYKSRLKRELGEFRTPIVPISRVLDGYADNDIASIMGVLMETKMQRVDKGGMQFVNRKLRIIDESEKQIEVSLWNSMAMNFHVSLYSIILIKNFRIHINGDTMWGDCVRGTEITDNPTDLKNQRATKRLKIWFSDYRKLCENTTDKSSTASAATERTNVLSNDEKMEENSERSDDEDGRAMDEDESNLDSSMSDESVDSHSDSPDLFSDN